MDFKSEVTPDSLLESIRLPGPTATTTNPSTNKLNGSKHVDENISQDDNFSTDFEAMDDDNSPCLSSSRINLKSKSNPLLDQLLDKPLDSGDLGIFGYSGNYEENSSPDEPAQSFINEENNSLFDICMEAPYTRSKAQSGPGGASDPDEESETDDQNGESNSEEEDSESEEIEEEEDEGEDAEEEDDEEYEEGEEEDNEKDKIVKEEDEDEEEEEEGGEEEEEEEASDIKPEAKENGDGVNKINEQLEVSPVQVKDEDGGKQSCQTTTSNESTENNKSKRKKSASIGSGSGKGKGKGKGVKRKSTKSPGKNVKKAKRYMMRKNIKKIISEGEVNVETLKAQAEEAERLKRVEERAALMKQQNQYLLQQNSQDDVMILSSDDELITPCHSGYGVKKNVSDADVIEIASEDDYLSDDDLFPPNHNNFNKSSTLSVFSSSGRSGRKDLLRKRKTGEDEYIDTNNDGTHTDDRFNQPDEEGRVLVNVGHPEEEKPIYLPSQLSRAVKPHQIGGIRFLYDNIIDSLRKHRTSEGLGCILAHSMGLGKTLQLISFIDIYLTHTQAKHVLCIVPINTLQNWMSEFDMWLPSNKTAPFRPDSSEIKFRQFDIFMLNDCKTLTARSKEIIAWRKAGGVLLIGYEMYRLLTTDGKAARGRKAKTKEVGLPQETYDNLMTELKEALVDPGPDLVICDEGHRIKNCNAATSLALKNIRTRRRVVLTGYPLQNNLIEYWCMVDFVRPNFLGNKQEFCNMFERPISNGQCADSTAEDKRNMKSRAHVLHKLLRGFVQRRSHSILTKSLPRKHEHVILVRMTPIQRKLMIAFLDRIKSDADNSHRLNPIMLFSVFCKVWNHPDILYKIVKEGQNFDDLDIDLGGEKTQAGGKKSTNKKKGKTVKNNNKRGDKNLPTTFSDNDDDSFPVKSDKNKGNKNGSSFLTSDVFSTTSNDYLEGINGGSKNPSFTDYRSSINSVNQQSHSSSNSYQQSNNSTHLNSFASKNINNYSNNNYLSSFNNHQTSTNNLNQQQHQQSLDLEIPENNKTYNLNQPCSSNNNSNSYSNFQSNDWGGTQDISSLIGDYTNNLDGLSSASTSTAPTLPGQYPNRMMDYTWAEPLVTDYKPGLLQNGLKMLLFFEMVEQTILKKDKLLVFSHSLFTLDIIEKFLSQRRVPKPKRSTEDDDDDDEPEKWCKGANYFRIDGSTSASEREKLINVFNKNKNVYLFLLSTRAGCLGINLIGANRIIVFDASWNPCHDAQAACRIYRYGQQKECFIYRLICDESLEKRIYDRQITKQEVSCRVVDELNPETNFTRREIDSLMEDLDQINLTEVKNYTQEECEAYDDDIIQHICKNMNHCLSKPPFEHESLLLDHKESKLSYQEKKLAEEEYFRKKQEMAEGNASVTKHSNYIANMTANMANNVNNGLPNGLMVGGQGDPLITFGGPNIPVTPPKPTLGRPTKYPSVGMLPPSALKPGHSYTPFANPVWNSSLAQSSSHLTGHQYFQQSRNNQCLQQPSQSMVQQPFTGQTLRFPPILSRSSIINQCNNLPPAAFMEQLSRMGYSVKKTKIDKPFEIPTSSSGEKIIVPSGQEIIMIRSRQNDYYLRTSQGRMFSLKGNEPIKFDELLPFQATPMNSNMSSQNHASTLSRNLPSTSSCSQPELICLDDDD